MKTDRADAKILIKAHLSEMLKEKTLDEISVSDLCKKAKISRSTFYTYYDGKHQVLEDIVYDDFAMKIEQTFSVIASMRSETIGHSSSLLMTEIMLQSIYEKRDFYLPLAQRGKAKPLARALANASKRLRESIVPGNEEHSSEKYRYAVIHGASSMTSIVIEWLRDGATVSPKLLAEWVCEWNRASNLMDPEPSKR